MSAHWLSSKVSTRCMAHFSLQIWIFPFLHQLKVDCAKIINHLHISSVINISNIQVATGKTLMAFCFFEHVPINSLWTKYLCLPQIHMLNFSIWWLVLKEKVKFNDKICTSPDKNDILVQKSPRYVFLTYHLYFYLFIICHLLSPIYHL